MATRVWTIGHSTRSIEEFLALLRESRIEVLADIRRFPTSRWPQFRQESLRDSLAAERVEYRHLADLGGYRPGGYVAFTATPEFARGLQNLVAMAAERRTAIMCAEVVFFRCHRRYVADALVRRGVEVVHVMGPGKTRRHVAQERLADVPEDSHPRDP